MPDGSLIVGGAGNDTITIAAGNAEPEGGDNIVYGTPGISQVVYWNAPTGIVANLQTGIVQNGYGGTDHLTGITELCGSAFSDSITGSSGNDTLFGSGGNDVYWGNGGVDTVQYYGNSSGQAQVTYDSAADSWTIVKTFDGGGTDVLHGIDVVKFDDKTYYSPHLTPVSAPAGVANATVSQIVPFNLGGHQDLLVLWTAGSSGTAIPLQVLQVGQNGALSDITASLFSGAVAQTTNPRNIIVADLNGDGQPDILIANQGQDSAPFPGSTNTLLLSNGSGGFTDASSSLPQGLTFNHDLSEGVVAAGGTIGVFINSIYSQANNPPQYLIGNGHGGLTDMAASYLPAALRSTSTGYTSSVLTDLNGDGYADLVVGAEDQSRGASLVYLNPGNGDFSKVTPIALPASPLSTTGGLYDANPAGAVILDIQAIHLSSATYSDLVVVSTNGDYTGYAIQILINDGSGHFTDQTTARLSGAPASQTYSSGQPWMIRSFVTDLNGDGTPDLVFEGTNGVPGEAFLNDGSGHFSLAYSVSNAQIMAVDTINGVPSFVEYTYSGAGPSILTVPFAAPGGTIVTESSATVAANLDELEAMATAGTLAKITLTDSGIPALSLSAAQLVSDAGALKAISGSFSLTVTALASSATIAGDSSALGNTLILSGAASQYSIAASGDGSHFTLSGNGVIDTISDFQALRFSDHTVLVAQAPGTGSVTTGNITELYGAVFGRLPDVPGLAFYEQYLAKNPTTALTTFAQYFLQSSEYTGNSAHAYAQSAAGDAQFITDSYKNLLNRVPESGAVDYYQTKVIDPLVKGLTAGTEAYTQAELQAHALVLTYFSQSPEFLGDVQVSAAHPADATHWLVLI